MCPECNEWMMLGDIDSEMPTKMPTPRVPTHTPTIWRQWANEDWMSEITRRDSSASMISVSFGMICCLVTAYFIYY